MKTKRANTILAAALPLITAACVLCALCFGSVPLSLRELAAGLAGRDRTAAVILLQLRLPRVTAAALAGSAFSAAGLLLQSATGNDLAAPGVTGINSGAGLGVMLLLCFCPSAGRLLPLGAFAGASGAAAVVLLLSGGRSRAGILLAGAATASLTGAVISLLSLRFPDALVSYAAFTAGGFSGVNWSELGLPAIGIALGLAAAALLRAPLRVLSLGDENARNLGVRVRGVRLAALAAASGLCACAVSFAGLLGFVGLLVPHLMRLLGVKRGGFLLPGCCLLGSALCVLADLAGRVLFSPTEVPAGIFTACIGAPFFLILLGRRQKRGDLF